MNKKGRVCYNDNRWVESLHLNNDRDVKHLMSYDREFQYFVYVPIIYIARHCIISSSSISFRSRIHKSEQHYISLLKTSNCIILLVIEKVNLLRDFIML